MQSQLLFSLITKCKIVISVIAAVILLSACKREEETVFTDTVYASGDNGYAVSGGSSGETASTQESGSGRSAQTESAGIAKTQKESSEETICVFVCGAVRCEGVYELPALARVIDAVEAAGGYLEDADRRYVNQAEYVYDTQRIEIPTIEEAQILRESCAQDPETGDATAQGESRININTADRQELMKIPGIGESKADRIIEYRQIHGRFGAIEEIMNVSGIGSGMFENMKDYITVG